MRGCSSRLCDFQQCPLWALSACRAVLVSRVQAQQLQRVLTVPLCSSILPEGGVCVRSPRGQQLGVVFHHPLRVQVSSTEVLSAPGAGRMNWRLARCRATVLGTKASPVVTGNTEGLGPRGVWDLFIFHSSCLWGVRSALTRPETGAGPSRSWHSCADGLRSCPEASVLNLLPSVSLNSQYLDSGAKRHSQSCFSWGLSS